MLQCVDHNQAPWQQLELQQSSLPDHFSATAAAVAATATVSAAEPHSSSRTWSVSFLVTTHCHQDSAGLLQCRHGKVAAVMWAAEELSTQQCPCLLTDVALLLAFEKQLSTVV
jgi:hypothetical protein